MDILNVIADHLFSDDILGVEFRDILENLLTKRERQAVEMKVEGYTYEDIGRLMGISVSSVYRLLTCAKNKIIANEKYDESDARRYIRLHEYRSKSKRIRNSEEEAD